MQQDMTLLQFGVLIQAHHDGIACAQWESQPVRANIQSSQSRRIIASRGHDFAVRVKLISLYKVSSYLSQNAVARHWPAQFISQVWSAGVQAVGRPTFVVDVQQIHPGAIRVINCCNFIQEEWGQETADKRNSLAIFISGRLSFIDFANLGAGESEKFN